MTLADRFDHWAAVHVKTLETVDLFTDDDLDYVALCGGLSVHEIMLHVANAEAGWIRYIAAQELPGWPANYTPKRYPTLADVRDLLGREHEHTMAYLREQPDTAYERAVVTPWGAETTLGWVAWHVLEHEIHHRGELSLILGLLGREGPDV